MENQEINLTLKTGLYSFIIMAFLFSGCASSADKLKASAEEPHAIYLKYPIVLVHGIARNDREKTVHPWGRIPETLREYNVQFYYGDTDAWGTIESNAELLKTTIDKILAKTKNEKVNIIAHSKGGIDSRYCIWKYQYGDRVASLTTISTPHHGSEIADLLYNSPIIHTATTRRRLKIIGEMFGDVHPDIYTLNYELTTWNMTKFNEDITLDKRVYYQSIYSTMAKASDDLLLSSTHNYIKKMSGNNDGLVSEKSAIWGNQTTKIPGSLSHEQIIGHNKNINNGIDVPAIYLEIITELSELGF